MVASILLTGAFHEDGFADTCDGFGGGWKANQVLTITKDSRLGTYGACGLFAILAIKFTALHDLYLQGLGVFALAYVSAHVFSRQLSSLVIEFYDYVQDIDASKIKPITDRRLNDADLKFSLLLPALLLLILITQAATAGLIALTAAMLSAMVFAGYSKSRIGGYTGDVLGAIQQTSEVVFYIGFIALI